MLGFARKSWVRLIKEGSWVLLGQGAMAIAGLVGVRLLTELAPKSVFGEVSLLLGLLTIGKSIFVSPVVNFQVRYQTEYTARGQLREFMGRISRLCWQGTAMFLLVGIVAYLARWLLLPEPFRPLLLGILVCLVCLETVRAVESTQVVAERKQGHLAAWLAVEMWLAVALAAAGLWLLPTVEGYLAGTAAAWMGALMLFRPRPHESDTASPPVCDRETGPEFTRRVLAYGLPFVPLALFSWVINLGDRYILGTLTGFAEVGLYVAAYGIASRSVQTAGGVLAVVVRPVLFQAESDGRRDSSRRIFLLWLAATCGISAAVLTGLAAFGDQIAYILLAPDYRQGAPTIMVWVGLGYGLYNVIGALENRFLSRNNSRGLVLPAAFGATANLALNYVLIPRSGAIGAAQATAGAFAAQLIILLLALGLQSATEIESSNDLISNC